MTRMTLMLATLIGLTVWPPANAVAQETVMSPAEVVQIDRALDGELVTLEGEAVGEPLRALGGGWWINLLGDDVGIGVWVTDEMAEKVTHFGSYDSTGDTVRVTGPVNVACDVHEGEFDVHAESLRVVAPGELRVHRVAPVKLIVGFAGMAIAFALWRYYAWRRDRLIA